MGGYGSRADRNYRHLRAFRAWTVIFLVFTVICVLAHAAAAAAVVGLFTVGSGGCWALVQRLYIYNANHASRSGLVRGNISDRMSQRWRDDAARIWINSDRRNRR
jgi:hypothetical protein